jgi:hypothetical protein
LAGPQGWQHAAGRRWPHRYYASHASTIFRITDEMPRTPQLIGGGAHVENPAAFLLSGRARDWLGYLAGRAAAARRKQSDDGLFHYSGRFREGHFEDTAGVRAEAAIERFCYCRVSHSRRPALGRAFGRAF